MCGETQLNLGKNYISIYIYMDGRRFCLAWVHKTVTSATRGTQVLDRSTTAAGQEPQKVADRIS